MENFDVVIVGAGPAGCAAAYKLAKAGQQVLVVERGKHPGAKNVSGGIIYSRVLNDLIPNFWEAAPVERRITSFVTAFLSDNASFTINLKSKKFDTQPYNAFSVLRAKFDRWFASEAEKAGATIVTNIRVDELLWKEKKIIGIRAGSDEIEASVVIAADGAKSFMAQKAGLRRDFTPKQVAIAVKEVVELPRQTVEERFNLRGDEGAAYTLIGYTKGIQGGGFLYTNKESLSVGVVAHIQPLVDRGLKTPELIEDYRTHPFVANLLDGGKVVEYSGDIIHEGGLDMLPRLYTDGFLVAGNAASLILNNALTFRGVDFAIASGLAAAETVIKAKERKDFSKNSLSLYEKMLNETFVLKDLRTFRKVPYLLENRRIYTLYPDLLCRVLEELYTVDGSPKRRALKSVCETVKGKTSLRQLLSDGIRMVRTL